MHDVKHGRKAQQFKAGVFKKAAEIHALISFKIWLGFALDSPEFQAWLAIASTNQCACFSEERLKAIRLGSKRMMKQANRPHLGRNLGYLPPATWADDYDFCISPRESGLENSADLWPTTS